MPIPESIRTRISVDPAFSVNDRDVIWASLDFAYSNSPRAAQILNSLSPTLGLFGGSILSIVYSKNDARARPSLDSVYFDPNFLYMDGGFGFFDQKGVFRDDTIVRTLMHEISHALAETRDPLPSNLSQREVSRIIMNTNGFDVVGDTVRDQNKMTGQWGDPTYQVSYYGGGHADGFGGLLR